jgi:PleD family two-component response regulator
LSLDTQQSVPESMRNVMAKSAGAPALIAEVVRILGSASEQARILVVDENESTARAVARIFSGEICASRTAGSREQAMEESLSFQPHVLVLNIGLSESEGFNLVDWLREQDSLTRLLLVVYSGPDLASIGAEQSAMEPTAFLKRARVQPEQLETLLLTMLRGGDQIEVEEEVSDISGVRGF